MKDVYSLADPTWLLNLGGKIKIRIVFAHQHKTLHLIDRRAILDGQFESYQPECSKSEANIPNNINLT